MIKPFGKNILIKPVKKEQVVMSENSPLCEYGEVIAIGSEVEKIKVGETIGFLIWGVNTLEIGEDKHYFVPEDSKFILGTLE